MSYGSSHWLCDSYFQESGKVEFVGLFLNMVVVVFRVILEWTTSIYVLRSVDLLIVAHEMGTGITKFATNFAQSNLTVSIGNRSVIMGIE